jgi:hypothetical protein
LIRSRRHAGWTFALALIVLVAQLGAQAHAYSHLVPAPDAAAHHLHPAPCVQCSSFAPLLTLAGGFGNPTVLAIADPAAVYARPVLAAPRAAACRAYRSRAPPIRS